MRTCGRVRRERGRNCKSSAGQCSERGDDSARTAFTLVIFGRRDRPGDRLGAQVDRGGSVNAPRWAGVEARGCRRVGDTLEHRDRAWFRCAP